MKLDFSCTGVRTYAVWADDERVGNLILGAARKPWMFIERLDYLGISPKAQREIRAAVTDYITLLNITARLTS